MSDPLLLINDHSLYAIISVRYIVSAVQSRTNIHMYCVPPCEVTFARPACVTKHYNLTSSVYQARRRPRPRSLPSVGTRYGHHSLLGCCPLLARASRFPTVSRTTHTMVCFTVPAFGVPKLQAYYTKITLAFRGMGGLSWGQRCVCVIHTCRARARALFYWYICIYLFICI